MAKPSIKPGAGSTAKPKAAGAPPTADQFAALQSRVAVLETVLQAFGRQIGSAPGFGIHVDAEAGGSDGGGEGSDGGGSDGGGEGGDGGGSDGGDGGGGDGGDARRAPKRPKGPRR